MQGSDRALGFCDGRAFYRHPGACAAGIATLDIYEDEALVTASRRPVCIHGIDPIAGIELDSREGAPGTKWFDMLVDRFGKCLPIGGTDDVAALSSPRITETDRRDRPDRRNRGDSGHRVEDGRVKAPFEKATWPERIDGSGWEQRHAHRCTERSQERRVRVGTTLGAFVELTRRGHEVVVEEGAGIGSGLDDESYRAAGASIATNLDEIFAADMIVKVKEALAEERKRLRPGRILFTYLHLAPDRPRTEDLLASGAVCIACETVTSPSGSLPLLVPMSEAAGRLAPQVGAHALEKAQGGRGILLGGVPGVPATNVVILGGGVSGAHVATIAVGMGAHVTMVDRAAETLQRLSAQFGASIHTKFSTRSAIDGTSGRPTS